MKFPRSLGVVLLLFGLVSVSFASAYNGRPHLVVIIVIDQLRADYLERYHDQFGEGGFRVFMDRGAYFTDCNYDYANMHTAPGHATLFTGAYTSGHGILANQWWDPQKKKVVTSVEDAATKIVGITNNGPGASPHNLRSDTLGDELKLATGGKSRVFAISLKDRAAVLPGGYSGDGVYWIDPNSGLWITSTYYRPDLPQWVRGFNDSHRAQKYLNKEWKDSDGKLLGATIPRAQNGKPPGFLELVGSTPYGNDYELEFAKELVLYEKLGTGGTTDMLSISLSANDLVGHEFGPDSPQVRAMTLATDRSLAEFINFLGHQIGLANVWLALSADHGIAPLPEFANSLHLPASRLDATAVREQANSVLSSKYGHPADYLTEFDFPLAFLNQEAFAKAGRKEGEAETDTGEALVEAGFSGYYSKSQVARGATPPTELGRRYGHSYSPEAGWYVWGVPNPFALSTFKGTNHATPFSYDTHVPLAFYGLAFQPGVYRTHAEPVDLAVTLASLLGINPPAQATGRVLTEAVQPPRKVPNSATGETR